MFIGVLLSVNGSHLAVFTQAGGRRAPLPDNFPVALYHLCSIPVEHSSRQFCY
jgi:hypothetical protein